MRKIFTSVLAVFLVVSMPGCFAERHGDDLTALIERVNKSFGSAALSAEGFVIDESAQNAYCFLACADGKEVLVSVDYDQKSRLTACHAVFDGEASEAVKAFVPVYFTAFTGDASGVQTALSKLSAFSGGAQLNESVYETESYRYTLTSTEQGTVLTCEKVSTTTTQSASTQTHSASEAP